MKKRFKKPLSKPVLPLAISLFLMVLVLSPKVFALDLGETILKIREALFGQNYLQETTEGEYLLEGKHPNFQAYFGDRKTNGSHRVRLAKDNLGFEFSFQEGEVTELAAGSSVQPTGVQEEIPFTDKDLTSEQKVVLGELEAQVEEIETYQATLGARLEELKEEVASIDRVIQNTIPGTDIGYDELGKNQLVVRNSQVRPNMDIYYWQRENDLREKIIFRSPPAPSKLTFDIKTEGLIAFDIGAGVIYFKDYQGNYIFRVTKGFIKDLTGAFSNQVETLVKNGQLVHTLDQAWLDSPERIYPLSLYFDFQLLGEKQTIASVKARPTIAQEGEILGEKKTGKIVKELLERRTLFSKTFVKEDGSFQEKIGVGPIHYPEEDGQLEEIDPNFTASSLADYDFEVVKGFFKTRFKKNFDSSSLAQYLYQDQEIQLELGNLSWLNDQGEERVISSPQSAEATTEGNLLKYPNAYGKGIGVEFLYHPQYLGKYLTINRFEDLPVSEEATFSGNLKFDFKIKLSEGISVYLEGKEWNGEEQATQEAIEFKNQQGETLFSFKKPYAVDRQGQEQPIKLRVRKQEGWLWVSKLIEKEWLAQASYPVKADADTIYLEGDTYDMYHDSKAGDQDALTTVNINKISGALQDGYWAFPISGTIIGSTINSVTFTGYLSANTSAVSHNLYGLDQEDCPALEGAEAPSGYTRTTASYAWNLVGAGTGSKATGDIKTVFNEWVSDYSHASPPDRFGIVIDDSLTGNAQGLTFYDYSNASYSNHSYLTIDYSAANSPPTAPTLLFVNETDASSGVTTPWAVGDSTPVFSAWHNDSDEGDVALYYQLIVYSEGTCTTQVWDSTKTLMSSCTEDTRCLTASGLGMAFGGTALRLNGKQYYWQIRFWDDSDAEGALSACASGYFYILGPADQLRHGNYFFNRTTERIFTW